MRNKFIICAIFASLILLPVKGRSCSNVIVTKGASADGSVLVSYSADSHQIYGELYHTPAGTFAKGSKLAVYCWDNGKFMGNIPQVPVTYSTMGNMNEHQLIFTETTFGGREELVDTTGIMDYGALIFITLQRAKSAREAIAVVADLVERYGYASEGESFSIADPNEVWIMEIVGKGVKLNKKGENVNRGANWVAVRIPDGCISAHANQSRITTFNMNDPENCLYSKGIVEFARQAGYFSGKDEEFSFADAFAPADFGTVRGCDARVWSAFNILGEGKFDGVDAMEWMDYINGENLAHRLPLYIKPARKLTVKDIADVMRDHYEDTPLDMRKDAGAGGFELPYRWRPMHFEYDGKSYFNERAIATQQTGYWMVGQARGWLPDIVGGVIWFGVDDAATSCLTPVYTSGLHAPRCFAEGNGDMITYSDESAFWLFNKVAQQCYLRYNYMAPEVQKAAAEHEEGALQVISLVDEIAKKALESEPDQAVAQEKVKALLTDWSDRIAERMFKRWKMLSNHLLVKYIDGNIKKQNPDGSFKTNGYSKSIPEMPSQPGYSEKWKEAVAKDLGDRLLAH